MTKQEALEVLKTINEMYPRFELTKRKAVILIPNLKKMDYKGVMKNLSAFVMENPYPPLISEIAAYPDDEASALEEIEQWKEEAKKVSPEMKERFKHEFQKLVEKMGGK